MKMVKGVSYVIKYLWHQQIFVWYNMYIWNFPVKIIPVFSLHIADCLMLKTDDGEKWTFKLSSNFTILQLFVFYDQIEFRL